MKANDAADLDSFIQRGGSDSQDVQAAANLEALAGTLLDDPRYSRAKNSKDPNKIGSQLELLDCITCDKCVPVCPNAANFTVVLPMGHHRGGLLAWTDQKWELREGRELQVNKKHQIGNTGDLCNLCGQCDTWCPEDGGPYIVKPTVFLHEGSFADHPHRDGFLLSLDRRSITWRRSGEILHYRIHADGSAVVETASGTVRLRDDQPQSTLGSGELEMADVITMRLYLEALAASGTSLWLPLAIQAEPTTPQEPR
jgi:putative selenate reductase